jgi:hypothetical protein
MLLGFKPSQQVCDPIACLFSYCFHHKLNHATPLKARTEIELHNPTLKVDSAFVFVTAAPHIGDDVVHSKRLLGQYKLFVAGFTVGQSRCLLVSAVCWC